MPPGPAGPTPRPHQARRSLASPAGVPATAAAKPANQPEHYYYLPYKFLLPPTAAQTAQVRLPFTVTQAVLESMKPRCV